MKLKWGKKRPGEAESVDRSSQVTSGLMRARRVSRLPFSGVSVETAGLGPVHR